VIRIRASINPRTVELESLFRLDAAVIADAARLADVPFRSAERTIFATEGQSGGAPWHPLAPATIARKRAARRRGHPASLKILHMTGRMRKAFGNLAGEHLAYGDRGPRGWRIVLGASGPPYAVFHAQGGPRLPVRPPINLTAANVADIREGIARGMAPHIARRIRAIQAWRGSR